MKKFTSLDDILGKDQKELTACKMGEYETEKLGLLAFREIDPKEYRQIKKDSMHMVQDPNGKRGAMISEVDDNKMMANLILATVDKESTQPDARSNFTFANKALLDKLGVSTAVQAVEKLLSIGEIQGMAIAIQDICGFTEKAAEEEAEEIKN